jgi:hypothetical protein
VEQIYCLREYAAIILLLGVCKHNFGTKLQAIVFLIGAMKNFSLDALFSSPPANLPRASTPTTIPSPLPTATRTPIPVTYTPQPTPTIEFTPTAFPRFFTDEFDTSLTGWDILQAGSEGTPTIKNENSSLILQMDAPYNWVYAIYGAQDYGDIRVDALFTNQAGSPASIGLVCRYSETEGWLEYNVSTDGTYSLLYGNWLASGIADYFPVMDGSSKLIQPSEAAQEIGMICSGMTVSLLVNQTVVRNIDVSRYELTGGKVGITASAFENAPVVAAFNWVRVSEP